MGTQQTKLTPEELEKRKKTNKKLLPLLLIIFIGLGAIMYFGHDDIPEEEVAIVHNDEFDASVKQVEDYLKANLNDPDSYDGVEWGPVQQHPETKEFFVRHKYRAKNAFGGVITCNQLFFMDSLGIVIKVQDYQ